MDSSNMEARQLSNYYDQGILKYKGQDLLNINTTKSSLHGWGSTFLGGKTGAFRALHCILCPAPKGSYQAPTFFYQCTVGYWFWYFFFKAKSGRSQPNLLTLQDPGLCVEATSDLLLFLPSLHACCEGYVRWRRWRYAESERENHWFPSLSLHPLVWRSLFPTSGPHFTQAICRYPNNTGG